MSNLKRISATALLATLAAGCGGGGGGGSNNGPANVNDAPITADNASEIAGEVVEGMMEIGSLGNFGDLGGLPTAAAGHNGSLSKMAAQVATKTGEARAKAAPGMLQAAFGPEQSDCAVDGTVTISANLREVDTLSAGDRLSFGFDGCDDGDGEVISGDLTLRVTSFSGDFLNSRFAIAATMEFEVFAVTEGDETNTVNGDFSLSIDTMDYPTVVFSQWSDSLDVSDDVGTLVMADWTTTVVIDESSQPAAYTLTGDGSVEVPRYGSVSYEVREPLTGYGEDDPDSGVLYVEGGEGANITITALSSTQVRLEMDYDGDGVIDETAILTWVELDD